ncbi:class I SAM-dependent methyltransferase [Candidatus Peregrinibacteria bacterium]|nr:MAG: class I SAM-dependent methyltransferase [Candidatus Peregrinibacteria bacterium]
MIEPYLKQYQLSYPHDRVQQLNEFVRLFLEKNQVLNLTRVHTDEEFIVKHVIDSLMVDHFVDFRPGQSVADLGAGEDSRGFRLRL